VLRVEEGGPWGGGDGVFEEWTECEESCLFGGGEETEGMGKRLK